MASGPFGHTTRLPSRAQAFHETEHEFLNIAGREGLRDGTTAVCAVIQKGQGEETLTVAHVGDSRGVLCRAGLAVAITEDHKPDLAPEKVGATLPFSF